jgi:hypothetical protein
MPSELDDLEAAVRIIDELVCLGFLVRNMMDFNIIDRALLFIAQYRLAHPETPITVALDRYMREHGFVAEQEG